MWYLEKQEDITIKLSFLKKNWFWILLLVILVFGLYLRVYHIDYPVIGYHNWKEAHYLGEARNFANDGFFKHGLFIPEWDYPRFWSQKDGAHTDALPMLPMFISLFFRFFGSSLLIARLIVLLASTSVILLMFLLVKQLFKRDDLALICALLTAINPLFVFFGRQVQIINFALPFMLLAAYFYLLWRENFKTKQFIYFSIFFVLCLLNKYDFFIIIFPILFTFPYRHFFKKIRPWEKWQYYLASFIMLLFPLWLLYTYIKAKELSTDMFAKSTSFVIFKKVFYTASKAFIADNFTLIGFCFVILGVFFIFVVKNKYFGKTFVIAFIFGSPIWIFIAQSYLKGHSYHQYPIAPLFIILIGYSFLVISNTLSRFVKLKYRKYAKFILLTLLFILIFLPSKTAWERQFNTQFPGHDLAGEYIKKHSEIDERIFRPGHQIQGLLWHSNRKGHVFNANINGTRLTDDINLTKKYESEYNIRWLYIYQWGMQLFEEPSWDYFKNNYSLKQFAFQKTKQGIKPVYFLLKKGGSFDISELDALLQKNTVKEKKYEYTSGDYTLYYIDVE